VVFANPCVFVGVEGAEPEREGVPGAELSLARFDGLVLADNDRSRKEYSFLYARGGHGGWPSSGGSLRALVSLE
jgi:hypothetical protein